MDIKKPHDKFFLESFQHKSVAIAYVQNFLPKAVSSQLDYQTFKLDNQSYINKNLQDFFSDVVYECETVTNTNKSKSSKLKIALLFEHKSYVPKYPLLQILEYILSIWKADQKQKRALTLVIPIVIYHGEYPNNSREWKHKKLTDMFDIVPNFMQPFIPNFEIHLTNISATSDETIKKIGPNFLTNTFLALKYSRDLAYVLKNFGKLFIFREQFLNSTLGDNQFIALFVYLSTVTKIKDMEDLIQELPVDLQKKGLSAYEKALLKGENRIKEQMEKYKIELEAQAQAKVDKALKKIKAEKAASEKARKKAEAEKVASEKARKKAEAEKVEAEKAALEKIQKDKEEQSRKTIVNLLKSGALSEEQIADIMSVSIDSVTEIKKVLK